MPAWANLLRRALVAALLFAPGTLAAQTSDLVSNNALRVCADPANYPMSNDAGEGYENKLAELIAGQLDLPVQYTWYPQATGFIRNTLKAKRCDIVMGYAQGHELVLNTNHYFTSAYALIVPEDGDLATVQTLGDPALDGRRVGIIAGTPPAAHMARNGLIAKAKVYNLVVDRRHESPVVDMLDDLAGGRYRRGHSLGAAWRAIGQIRLSGHEGDPAGAGNPATASFLPNYDGRKAGRKGLAAQAQFPHPAQSG